MDAGRIFDPDVYEASVSVAASGSVSGYTTGASWLGQGKATLQSQGPELFGTDTIYEWARIEVTEGLAGTSVNIYFVGVHEVGPVAGTSGAIVFNDLKFYALTSAGWTAVYSSVDLYVDGVLAKTLSGASHNGFGFSPSHMPFLGLPMKVQGIAQAGPASGFGAPINFVSGAQVDALISGGVRWKYPGDASWTSCPVTPYNDLDVPEGGPFGIDLEGIILTTNSYGDHVNASAETEAERYGATGSCPGPNTFGDAQQTSDVRTGIVYLMHNIPRGYHVFEQADHCSLLRRGGFPETKASLLRTYRELGDSSDTVIEDTPTVHPDLEEAFFVETNAAATEIAAVTTLETLWAPVQIARVKTIARSTVGGADPCDDLAFAADREDKEAASVIFPDEVIPNADTFNVLEVSNSTHEGECCEYLNFWGSPHWSISHPPIDWEVDGVATAVDVYWWLVRTGFSALGAEAFNRYRRYAIMLCALLESAFGAYQDSQYGGGRWRGVTRAIAYEVEPPAGYTYASTSSTLWSSPDSSVALAFGATITGTPSSGTALLRLDQSDWSLTGPRGYPQIATDITLDWDATNITAVRLYVRGTDGRRAFVGADADIKGLVIPLPRGPADKYAGSWAIENGGGAVPDEGVDESGGDGVSSATMADIERATSFQLLPGTGRDSIEIEVDNTGVFDLDYPVLAFDPVDEPRVVCEHGSAQSLVWPTDEAPDPTIFAGADVGEEAIETRGGAGIRFGNVVFRDRDFNTWLSPYVTAGAGFKANITETLAFINVALLGENAQANVSTIVSGLFDSDEGNALADVELDTTGTMLPTAYQDVDKLRFALVATAREVPPLGQLPMRARDPDTFAEDGTPEQKAYVWCQEPCISVTAGPVGLQVWAPDGDDTVLSTVRPSIPGWTETQFNEQVNNSEPDGDQTDAYRIFYDGVELAKARPWRGWMLVHGLTETASGVISSDVSKGWLNVVANIEDGEVRIRVWDQAFTLLYDYGTGIGAEAVCIRWDRVSTTNRLVMWTEEAAVIFRRTLVLDSAVHEVGMATTIESGAKTPKVIIGLNTLRYEYWLTDASPATVRVQISDAAGTILTGPTAAQFGGGDLEVDPGGLTLDETNLGGGGHRIILWANDGGVLTRYVSADGVNFS